MMPSPRSLLSRGQEPILPTDQVLVGATTDTRQRFFFAVFTRPLVENVREGPA